MFNDPDKEPWFVANITIAFGSASIKERIDKQAKELMKIAQISEDKKTITFPDPHYKVTIVEENSHSCTWELVDPEWDAIKDLPIGELGLDDHGCGIINMKDISPGHSAKFALANDADISDVVKAAALSIAYANTTSKEIQKAIGVTDKKMQIMFMKGVIPTAGVDHDLD